MLWLPRESFKRMQRGKCVLVYFELNNKELAEVCDSIDEKIDYGKGNVTFNR